jgi:hypothetical protein
MTVGRIDCRIHTPDFHSFELRSPARNSAPFLPGFGMPVVRNSAFAVASAVDYMMFALRIEHDLECFEEFLLADKSIAVVVDGLDGL